MTSKVRFHSAKVLFGQPPWTINHWLSVFVRSQMCWVCSNVRVFGTRNTSPLGSKDARAVKKAAASHKVSFCHSRVKRHDCEEPLLSGSRSPRSVAGRIITVSIRKEGKRRDHLNSGSIFLPSRKSKSLHKVAAHCDRRGHPLCRASFSQGRFNGSNLLINVFKLSNCAVRSKHWQKRLQSCRSGRRYFACIPQVCPLDLNDTRILYNIINVNITCNMKRCTFSNRCLSFWVLVPRSGGFHNDVIATDPSFQTVRHDDISTLAWITTRGHRHAAREGWALRFPNLAREAFVAVEQPQKLHELSPKLDACDDRKGLCSNVKNKRLKILHVLCYVNKFIMHFWLTTSEVHEEWRKDVGGTKWWFWRESVNSSDSAYV